MLPAVTGEPMPPLHLPPPGFPAPPVHVPPPHLRVMGGQKRPFDGGIVDTSAGSPGYGPPAKRGFDFWRLGRGGRGGPRGGRGGFAGRGSTSQVSLIINVSN